MSTINLPASVQLLLATQNNDTQGVRDLIENSLGHLSISNLSGALIEAAGTGRVEMVELILPHMTDPNRQVLALKSAILWNHVDVVKQLAHAIRPQDWSSVLSMANDKEVLALLVELVPSSHQHLLEDRLIEEISNYRVYDISEMIHVLLPHMDHPLDHKFMVEAIKSDIPASVDLMMKHYTLDDLELIMSTMGSSIMSRDPQPRAAWEHFSSYVSKQHLLQHVTQEGGCAPRSKM